MLSALTTVHNPIFGHVYTSSGIKVFSTNQYKYTVMQKDEYNLRKNNIHRITSIENLILHEMKSNQTHTYVLQETLHTSNVQTYILRNYCSAFLLFTILNQCCNNIALYHGLLNCYHSNTSIANFNMFENNICRLSDIQSDDKKLTKQSRDDDYDMLFDTFMESISYKNKHFEKYTIMYRKSFMSKMS